MPLGRVEDLALVCALFGFYLAASPLAPVINDVGNEIARLIASS